MRLWKNDKYPISAYVLLLFIFISGFAYAADPSKVENKYIETGKIKFIHREIYFDKAGLWAAMTARCTNVVNRYFGMLELLYSEQSTWSRYESSDKIVDALLKISAKSGIKKAKAISCLENQEKALDLVLSLIHI